MFRTISNAVSLKFKGKSMLSNEISPTLLSKKAQNQLKEVDKFIDYHKKAKGCYPQKIGMNQNEYRLIETSMRAKKIPPPYSYNGITIYAR